MINIVVIITVIINLYYNIHIDCNCYSEVTKFIIFNVIWVMLPITIIIFDGD